MEDDEDQECEVNTTPNRFQGQVDDSIDTCCEVTGLCTGNDDSSSNETCGDKNIILRNYSGLSGTRWSDIDLGNRKSEEGEDDTCCREKEYCNHVDESTISAKYPEGIETVKCSFTIGDETIVGDKKGGSDKIEIFRDDNGNIDSITKINCCSKIPGLTSTEWEMVARFTNIEEHFTNKNIDNNNMYKPFTNIIEGVSNININTKDNCNVIKEELIKKLDIPKEQLILECKLNKQGTKYLIKAHTISTKNNPIPKDYHEKILDGIKIDSLGIEIKPKLDLTEEKMDKRVIIIILVLLIIAAIIGGIYMVKTN